MTRWATLAIALLFSAIAAVQYTGTAFGQAGGGWITLFDGKNLDQWQGDGNATFKIEDGSVIAVDKKDPKAVASYLVSKQSFKDFEIRAEFWVSDDANSGIFIRVTDPKQDQRQDRLRGQYLRHRAPIRATAPARSSDVAKALTVLKTGGKWNTYEITPKARSSPSCSTARRPWTARRMRFARPARSRCNSATGTVKFRKVEIKPL